MGFGVPGLHICCPESLFAAGDIGAQLDVHAALLPTINILPWLNWGRAQESYGEDR